MPQIRHVQPRQKLEFVILILSVRITIILDGFFLSEGLLHCHSFHSGKDRTQSVRRVTMTRWISARQKWHDASNRLHVFDSNYLISFSKCWQEMWHGSPIAKWSLLTLCKCVHVDSNEGANERCLIDCVQLSNFIEITSKYRVNTKINLSDWRRYQCKILQVQIFKAGSTCKVNQFDARQD